MANRERGEISFSALGQDWKIKLGTNAMCEIEDKTGKSIIEIGQLLGDQKTATLKLLRVVLWGGLQQYHEGIDLIKVGLIIDDIGMAKAGELIGEAFAAATSATSAKGGGAHPKKAAAK